MAEQCLDMANGAWLNYPHSGGAMDQDELLLSLVKVAWRAWHVFGYKPANKIKWSDDDSDFIAWVNKEDGITN